MGQGPLTVGHFAVAGGMLVAAGLVLSCPVCDEFAAEGAAGLPVIGSYPTYVSLAAETGGAVFTTELTGEALLTANQAFLDVYISTGTPFVLATPIGAAAEGSVYEAELYYLIRNGYSPNATGTMLLPP